MGDVRSDMAKVEFGTGKWYEDPQTVGRRIFFVLVLLMVALAQRHNIYWFIERMFSSEDSQGTGFLSSGWIRLMCHTIFFIKFLSSRTQAGLNKWTFLWCGGILLILTSQHALSFPSSCLVLVAGLAFKVCSHEISSMLKLNFAKKLDRKFKWFVLAAVLLISVIALATGSAHLATEVKTYVTHFASIGRLGREGWPKSEDTSVRVATPELLEGMQQPVSEPPLLHSKLSRSGGAKMLHVLLVGSPQDEAVRAVVQSLQSDGDFAVTIAAGYREAVSSITEYSFNAVVFPRNQFSSEQIEVGRVVLALKIRYHGELRPVREGNLVTTIGMLASRWPGGVESWRTVEMMPVAQ